MICVALELAIKKPTRVVSDFSPLTKLGRRCRKNHVHSPLHGSKTTAAGEYPCRLTLASGAETRVYLFEVTVKAPGVVRALEFVAAAGQKIIQEVPIVNNSGVDWTLRAQITEAALRGFHPPALHAEAALRGFLAPALHDNSAAVTASRAQGPKGSTSQSRDPLGSRCVSRVSDARAPPSRFHPRHSPGVRASCPPLSP